MIFPRAELPLGIKGRALERKVFRRQKNFDFTGKKRFSSLRGYRGGSDVLKIKSRKGFMEKDFQRILNCRDILELEQNLEKIQEFAHLELRNKFRVKKILNLGKILAKNFF